MNTQDFATRVAANLQADKDPTLDIFTIIMIIQLIMKLIDCMKNSEEKPDVTNPTTAQKAAAIKNIRDNLKFGQKFLAKRLFRGIMDEAQKIEAQELKNLVDQTS